MAWRSRDCGQSFQFVSVYDPALSDDPDVRTCENPQFGATTTSSGTPLIFYTYDMGGTDGQLVRVINGQMYLTYQCVGFERDPSKSQFVLDATRPLNKTLVAVADGQGVWKTLGVMKNARAWRMDIVQVPGNVNRFVFGLDEYLVEGYKNSFGKMAFPSTAKPVGPYTYGWDSAPAGNLIGPTSQSLIKTNIINNAITSRLPGSEQILVAFPDTFDKDRHGYRVLMYNPTTDKYADLRPILPKNTGASNIIFHLTPIDNGQGPVLLYWYDMDLKAKTATIRGRFIAGEKSETEDIDIRDVGGSAQFDLTPRPGYWYGDYHTAGGYTSEPTQDPTTKATTRRFFYFPIWVEPDASVKFTRVDYSKETPQRRRDYHRLTLNLIPERSFKPSPGPVERGRLNFSRERLRRVRELDRRLEVKEQPAIRRPQ